MTDEPQEHSAVFDVEASASSQRIAPAWITEAIVLLRALWVRWLPLPLATCMPMKRGRAGKFEVLDFVLVLLTYAASGATTLKDLYAQAEPSAGVLAAAWQRVGWPSRSALSRVLRAISPTTLAPLRTLF
jgi:hypothetical protein